jgi:MinD superfamily P-loop ATPase
MKTTISKALPVLDAEGYALCPDCNSHIKCGTIGLANLEKCCHGTKACKAAQEKQDKAKTRKDGTILRFLKPKAATMPSTVGSQAAVHSYKLAVTDASPTISTTP